ncbi:uncharacterized protein LOC120348174 isoform X4 [Styela clava]
MKLRKKVDVGNDIPRKEGTSSKKVSNKRRAKPNSNKEKDSKNSEGSGPSPTSLNCFLAGLLWILKIFRLAKKNKVPVQENETGSDYHPCLESAVTKSMGENQQPHPSAGTVTTLNETVTSGTVSQMPKEAYHDEYSSLESLPCADSQSSEACASDAELKELIAKMNYRQTSFHTWASYPNLCQGVMELHIAKSSYFKVSVSCPNLKYVFGTLDGIMKSRLHVSASCSDLLNQKVESEILQLARRSLSASCPSLIRHEKERKIPSQLPSLPDLCGFSSQKDNVDTPMLALNNIDANTPAFQSVTRIVTSQFVLDGEFGKTTSKHVSGLRSSSSVMLAAKSCLKMSVSLPNLFHLSEVLVKMESSLYISVSCPDLRKQSNEIAISKLSASPIFASFKQSDHLDFEMSMPARHSSPRMIDFKEGESQNMEHCLTEPDLDVTGGQPRESKSPLSHALVEKIDENRLVPVKEDTNLLFDQASILSESSLVIEKKELQVREFAFRTSVSYPNLLQAGVQINGGKLLHPRSTPSSPDLFYLSPSSIDREFSQLHISACLLDLIKRLKLPQHLNQPPATSSVLSDSGEQTQNLDLIHAESRETKEDPNIAIPKLDLSKVYDGEGDKTSSSHDPVTGPCTVVTHFRNTESVNIPSSLPNLSQIPEIAKNEELQIKSSLPYLLHAEEISEQQPTCKRSASWPQLDPVKSVRNLCVPKLDLSLLDSEEEPVIRGRMTMAGIRSSSSWPQLHPVKSVRNLCVPKLDLSQLDSEEEPPIRSRMAMTFTRKPANKYIQILRSANSLPDIPRGAAEVRTLKKSQLKKYPSSPNLKALVPQRFTGPSKPFDVHVLHSLQQRPKSAGSSSVPGYIQEPSKMHSKTIHFPVSIGDYQMTKPRNENENFQCRPSWAYGKYPREFKPELAIFSNLGINDKEQVNSSEDESSEFNTEPEYYPYRQTLSPILEESEEDMQNIPPTPTPGSFPIQVKSVNEIVASDLATKISAIIAHSVTSICYEANSVGSCMDEVERMPESTKINKTISDTSVESAAEDISTSPSHTPVVDRTTLSDEQHLDVGDVQTKAATISIKDVTEKKLTSSIHSPENVAITNELTKKEKLGQEDEVQSKNTDLSFGDQEKHTNDKDQSMNLKPIIACEPDHVIKITKAVEMGSHVGDVEASPNSTKIIKTASITIDGTMEENPTFPNQMPVVNDKKKKSAEKGDGNGDFDRTGKILEQHIQKKNEGKMSVIDPIPFQELDSHLPQSNKSFIEKATQTSDLEAEKFSSKFTKKQKKKVEVSKGNTESDQKVQKKVRAALLTTSSKSSTKFESKKDNVKTTKSTKKDQEPRKKSDGKMRAINSIPRKTLKTNLPASHKSLTNKGSQMNDMGAAKSKQVKGKKDKVPKGNIKSGQKIPKFERKFGFMVRKFPLRQRVSLLPSSTKKTTKMKTQMDDGKTAKTTKKVLTNFIKKRKGEAPKEIITNSKNKKGKGKDGLMNSKPIPVPSEPNLATSNTNEDEIGSHMGDVEKSSSCTKIIKVREIQTDKQKSRLMDKISTKAHASRLSTSTKKESQMDGLKTVKSTKKVKNRTEFTKSQKSNEKMDSRKEEKNLVYHKPDKGKSNSGIPVGPYKEKINNRHQMPRPNYGNRRKEVKTSTKHEDEDEEEIREEIEIDCSTNDVILRLRNFPFAPIRRNSMKNKQGAMAEKEGMHSNEEWYFRRGKNKWAHHEPEKQKPSPGMPVIKRFKDKFNNRMQITEQDYGSRDEAMMPKEDEENEEDEEIMEEIEIDCFANEESPPLWDFSLTALEKTKPKRQKATFEPYVTKLPRLNRKLDFYKRNWTNGHYGISSNLETRLGMPVKRQKGKPFVNRMEFLPRQIPYFGNKRKADKLKEQSEDGGYKYKPPWNFSTDVNTN